MIRKTIRESIVCVSFDEFYPSLDTAIFISLISLISSRGIRRLNCYAKLSSCLHFISTECQKFCERDDRCLVRNSELIIGIPPTSFRSCHTEISVFMIRTIHFYIPLPCVCPFCVEYSGWLNGGPARYGFSAAQRGIGDGPLICPTNI